MNYYWHLAPISGPHIYEFPIT
uniref:Uncharacterized protein n=1 Tax=Anguilla anguilla TaxID=7936 RepID=A0A0E9XVR0_ANGAN